MLVVKADNVSFSYGDKPIISQLSTVIMKGDRVGILGPNGSGKTTLLRLLLGNLQPDSGTIRLGTNLQISYFDQLREQLDEKKTVQENVVEDNQDTVTINGQKTAYYRVSAGFSFFSGPSTLLCFTPFRRRTQPPFIGPTIYPTFQSPGPG